MFPPTRWPRLMLEGAGPTSATSRRCSATLGLSKADGVGYTQVSIRKLKKIHTATHPGATLERTPPHPAARRSQPAAEEL